MPYVERTDDEIIATWVDWANENPNAATIYFFSPEERFSLAEAIERLCAGDRILVDELFIDPLRRLAQALDEDPCERIPQQDDTLIQDLYERIRSATDEFQSDAVVLIAAEEAEIFSFAARILLICLASKAIDSIGVSKFPNGGIALDVTLF